MTKAFTQNDILRYLYNETSECEKVDIEKELLINLELREFYNDVRDLISEISSLEIKAPDRAVNNILEFSRLQSLQFHQ